MSQLGFVGTIAWQKLLSHLVPDLFQTFEQCNMPACAGLIMLGAARDCLQTGTTGLWQTQIEYMAASLCSFTTTGMPALDCIK